MSVDLFKRQIRSLDELPSVASEIAQHFVFPSIVLFEGPLGAGKTTMIAALVKALGGAANEQVASPTFALHHAYETQRGPVDHWDLYRLESEDELESSGFWDQFLELESVILIEWPQRLERKWLPKTIPTFDLAITISDTGLRTVVLKADARPSPSFAP